MHWSHKFKLSAPSLKSRQRGIKLSLNKKLTRLYDIEQFALGLDAKPYVDLIRSQQLAKYQSQILTKYFRQPQKYLKLDCDRLSATITCTQNQINKLLAENSGITHFRSQAVADVLSIKKVSVGGINNKKQWKEDGVKTNKRPFYTHAYRIQVFNQRRKFFYIQIADGTDERSNKLGLRFDFIPDRFSEFEINLIFGHLKSVITASNYDGWIRKSNVTRVDLGVNFYGLMSPFIWAYNTQKIRTAKTRYRSDTWPKDGVTETAYLGSKSASSHFVLYEKLIKELKDDAEHLEHLNTNHVIADLAVTTRLERRHYPYRNICSKCQKIERKHQQTNCPRHKYCEKCGQCVKCAPKYKPLTITGLSDFYPQFDDIRFYDPIAISQLPSHKIRNILLGKSHHNVKNLTRTLLRLSRGKIEKRKIKAGNRKAEILLVSNWLKATWVKQQQESLLGTLQDIITKPKKYDSHEIADYISQSQPEETAISRLKTYPRNANNPKQNAAVEAPKTKNVLVTAGAGTGKTRTIVERVGHLIKNDVEAMRIRVIAYNTDAKNELGKRLNVKGYSTCHVSTFSAWCKRTLELSNPEFKGFEIIDSEQNNESGKYDAFMERIGLCGEQKSVFEHAYQYKVNADCSVQQAIDYAAKGTMTKEAFTKFISKYKEAKKQNSYWDFDDLLLKMYEAIKDSNEFRANVAAAQDYLVIDEMQDSSVIQWKIVRILAKEGVKLYCVGDPAQSIYGFRGSSYKHMEIFASFIPKSKLYELNRNYRSSPELINLSNWCRKQTNPSYSNLEGIEGNGNLPRLVEHSNCEAAIGWLVNDLRTKLQSESVGEKLALKQNQSLERKHVLILCRTNNLAKQVNTAITEAFEPEPDVSLPEAGLATTIHKVKGLESSIVYCMDPRFSSFPFDREDEHLRLIYVALTRATRELVICKSTQGNIPHEWPTDKYILDKIPDMFYQYAE